MLRRAVLAALVLPLALPSAAEDRVLAQPEKPGGQAAGEAPLAEPQPALPRPWKLCRVKLSLLLSSGGRTQLVHEETPQLFHGETHELEHEVPLEAVGRSALIRVRARVRAAIARPGGVLYHVTTQATLASAIGFATDEAGLDQIRHSYLEFDDTSTHLHEAFVSPGLGARLLLGIAVEPLLSREALGLDEELGLAAQGPLVTFHVESLLREKEKVRLLEQAPLTARLGHDVVFSMSRLGAPALEGQGPEHPLGGNVIVRDLAVLPDSGWGDDHVVPTAAPRDDYVKEHAASLDGGFLDTHATPIETADDPRTVTTRLKTRKLSERQKQRIRAQQEIAEVKRRADERSRTLPSGEALPAGFQREEFVLHVTPLHASLEHVQVEIRLQGLVTLPGDASPTSLDTVLVEELVRGEPFEVGLAEIARGGTPDYDYVFRIVALP